MAKPATQERFAKEIGVTQQDVSKHIAKGHLTRGATLKQWRLEYATHLREQAAGRLGKDGKLDLVAERARLAARQSEKIEIELAQLRNELWPRVTIDRHYEFTFASIRTKILALPSRQRSADPRMSPKQVAVAEQVVREILTELANVQLPADIDAETKKYFSDLHAAAEANGQPVGRRAPDAQPRKQRRAG